MAEIGGKRRTVQAIFNRIFDLALNIIRVMVFGTSNGTDAVALKLNSDGSLIPGGSLVTVPYDYVSLSYTGTNITQAVFKVGGSSGTVVATLDMTYSGNFILSVTKT